MRSGGFQAAPKLTRLEASGKIRFSLDQNHPLGRFKDSNRLLCDLASDALMLEDKLLIRRFNHGDTKALCRIYEKYRDDLLKVATALLNDRSDVEDVVHDVFVSFARNAGSFELRGSLRGYLSICAANRARDRNRAVRRARMVSLDEAGAAPAEEDRPDQSAVRDELSSQLACAMNGLAYEQREVIVLHLQSDMKFRQIAKSRGVSVNTIRSRYRYGLDKLRSVLDGELRQ